MATGIALLPEAQKINDHIYNVILNDNPHLKLEFLSKFSKLSLNTQLLNVDLTHTMHCARVNNFKLITCYTCQQLADTIAFTLDALLWGFEFSQNPVKKKTQKLFQGHSIHHWLHLARNILLLHRYTQSTFLS